jgi:hypothetical protein
VGWGLGGWGRPAEEHGMEVDSGEKREKLRQRNKNCADHRGIFS